MTLKGYVDRKKSSEGTADFATYGPVREGQIGLDVIGHVFGQLVTSDAAEASSTTRVIVATAHEALVGDVINWTSGNLRRKEYRVSAVATNAITVAEAMSEAPAAADTFKILRPKVPVLNEDGEQTIAATLNQAENAGQVGADTLRMVDAGRPRGIAPATHDHSSTPVTTSAYQQIIASTAAAVTRIYVADTSGSFLILALGAAASEIAQMYLAPGFAGWIDLYIPASTRVAIKALDADTAAGRFVISGLT